MYDHKAKPPARHKNTKRKSTCMICKKPIKKLCGMRIKNWQHCSSREGV